MTATNLIVQRSCVSLITDAAFYDEAGTIIDIASKVVVGPPELRMAIAVSGRVYACHIATALDGATTQREVFERLPIAAANIKAATIARDARQMPDLQLFVALWSDRTHRPEGWALSTDQAYFGLQYRPGTLVEIEQLCVPAIRAGGVNLDTFDPIVDGNLLLAEQRLCRHEGGGHYAVGGYGELTTVAKSGVRKDRLETWFDKVGHRILP